MRTKCDWILNGDPGTESGMTNAGTRFNWTLHFVQGDERAGRVMSVRQGDG